MSDNREKTIPRPGYLHRLFSPELDWIQVEVTTFCNARCIYCPHTIFREKWANRHLPIDAFKRILSAASRTQLIYLQGWGEPFMNPDFFAMAEMAKKAGCRVGVTTNGMLLDDNVIWTLVRQQIDVVAFSLAGSDEMNDTYRKGTRLETVLRAIRELNREKEANKSIRPAIHIAYLLLNSAFDSLQKLPRLLDNAGVAQVVISTLDLVLGKELEREAVRPRTNDEYEKVRARLDAIAAEAGRLNIDVHYQIRHPGKRRPVCTENVLRALFVSADGRVSPCVFTNLPLSDAAARMVEANGRPLEPLTFGNVSEQSLSRIWRTRTYAAFRHSHAAGKAAICRECPKLFIG
ncbi:MAG: radical SAM protein [Candidatus Abyssobacteria bacterium SURF_5]|uniref:Radical SAM protein n=1 Tax=Abyssobacteria bacterium (strain SURF_5) TaxID=2093360 RepID=A0A3A4NZ40_ABYX5|nr:MAG: radical SAM protein [Candidatus Abyssubacteria bacterium SURF_5]